MSGQENIHHPVRTLSGGRSGSIPSQWDGAGTLPAPRQAMGYRGEGAFACIPLRFQVQPVPKRAATKDPVQLVLVFPCLHGPQSNLA